MESWHFDDRRSKEALHAGIIRLYRRFLGVPSDAELSDDQILARSALPSPTELLRRARLRYLRTLYRCGLAAEWGLLFRDQPWRDLICDDLQWLWRQLCNSSSLQDPREHFPAWEYLLRYHGGYWKRLVNRGVRHAVLQRQSSTHVADFHARIFHRLCEAGTLATLAPTYVKPFVDQTYYGCLQCGVRCASRAGEGAHFFKVHQVINPVRFLFDSTQCPACLGEYHTVPKIQAHLRHSTACAELLQGDRLHCSPIPGRKVHELSNVLMMVSYLIYVLTDLYRALFDAELVMLNTETLLHCFLTRYPVHGLWPSLSSRAAKPL